MFSKSYYNTPQKLSSAISRQTEICKLVSRGRGSQRAWEKATFPCPRTPTLSGFLAGKTKMSVRFDGSLLSDRFQSVCFRKVGQITRNHVNVTDFEGVVFQIVGQNTGFPLI